MSAEIIILSIMLPILILTVGFLAYIFYRQLKFEKDFPVTLGNRIKSARGIGGRIQTKMNELVDQDINSLIEKNPVLLEIFPNSLPQAIEKQQTPHFLASVAQTLAPALLSTVVNQGAEVQVGSLIGQAITNPQLINGIMNAFKGMRENAKANYKRPATAEKKKPNEKRIAASSSPKAEGYD